MAGERVGKYTFVAIYRSCTSLKWQIKRVRSVTSVYIVSILDYKDIMVIDDDHKEMDYPTGLF